MGLKRGLVDYEVDRRTQSTCAGSRLLFPLRSVHWVWLARSKKSMNNKRLHLNSLDIPNVLCANQKKIKLS